MFALSLGVRNLDGVLPGVVYALLSGLHALTVGIIALAAVHVIIPSSSPPSRDYVLTALWLSESQSKT